MTPPVVTIDGPSSCGKGTIAAMLAKQLTWLLLDSGAIYRAVAWAVLRDGMDVDDQQALKMLLQQVHIEILPLENHVSFQVICDNEEITEAIRLEECGTVASQIAVYPFLREAVLPYQRAFRQLPGLVADGRDMGTVIFPDADVKFYFNADITARALRRQQQLRGRGINVSLRDIQSDLIARDRRDVNRLVAAAKSASDAILIDTTHLNIEAVFQTVLFYVKTAGFVIAKGS